MPHAHAIATRTKREIRCMDLGNEALGSRKALEGGCTQIQVRLPLRPDHHIPPLLPLPPPPLARSPPTNPSGPFSSLASYFASTSSVISELPITLWICTVYVRRTQVLLTYLSARIANSSLTIKQTYGSYATITSSQHPFIRPSRVQSLTYNPFPNIFFFVRCMCIIAG